MKKTPIILAIDSCLGNGSVALAGNDGIIAFNALPDPGSQAEKLVALMEKTLAETGVGYGGLSHIAVTAGPGSFTSVRIGLSAARGVAFASGLPVLAFSTLSCMANAAGGSNILAAIPAGRGEFYWQAFGTDGAAISEIMASQQEVIDDFMQGRRLTIFSGHADARNLAVLSLEAIQGNVIALPPQPIYVRPPDAKLPAKKEIL